LGIAEGEGRIEGSEIIGEPIKQQRIVIIEGRS